MNYFIDAMKKYFDFSGRTTRKGYWMFVLFYLLIYFSLVFLAIVAGIGIFGAFATIFPLLLLIPSISVAARRLHDIGRSGWWQLISLIPFIGLIVLIYFLVQDSSDDNEYGAREKIVAIS